MWAQGMGVQTFKESKAGQAVISWQERNFQEQGEESIMN
jgi:hypothetical protein